MTLKIKLLAAALPLAFAASSFAAEEPKKDAAPEPEYTLTGHVDLATHYYLRGATTTYGNASWANNGPGFTPTVPVRINAAWNNPNADAPESTKPVFQWGFDYVHASGWYAGYWASQVNYSYKALGESYDIYRGTKRNPFTGTFVVPFTAVGSTHPFYVGPADYYQTDKSIENDFYGGYNGKIGELGYNVGLTYYYYINGKYSNAPETKIALTYGEFGVSSQTLLDDTIWGNKGDTYWTATWTKALPYDLTFTANVGAYTYSKEGKFLGSKDPNTNTSCTAALGGLAAAPVGSRSASFFVNGCYWDEPGKSGPVSGAFRHLILSISQPIGSTGLTWKADAIIGGDNRYGVKQENKAALTITYGF